MSRHGWTRAAWSSLAPLLVVPCASAADWYVDVGYSGCGNGNGSAAKPYCTIAAAIGAASDGDTIHVAPGNYPGALAVDKTLTIVATAGAAATAIVDNKTNPLFTVSNQRSLALEGFTLSDALNAVLVLNGSALSAVDCVFARNVAVLRGACVNATDADVLLERCEVRDNVIDGSKGTGTNWRAGAGVSVEGGTLTLLDCSFRRNFTGGNNRSGQGSAVSAADGVVVTVERCFFEDNGSLGGDGGAIALLETRFIGGASQPVDATFVDCTFARNDADLDGGAIKARSGTELAIRGCLFQDNGAHVGAALDYSVGPKLPTRPLLIERCLFLDNGATAHVRNGGTGGAIRCAKGRLQLVDDRFERNFAGEGEFSRGTGGAVSFTDGDLTRCAFVANRAEGSKAFLGGKGGALAIDGDATLVDCVVEDNEATNRLNRYAGEGGGIYVNGAANVTLERCTVAGNRADTQRGNPRGGGNGGGVHVVNGGFVLLDHAIVAGNLSSKRGPDLFGGATRVDWNLVGDSRDAWLGGGGGHDLIDVDPLFADAAAKDFTLDPASPAVDSGDPALLPAGKDIDAFPRLLDGDFDGSLRIDRGGHEFSRVHLAISGSFTPGGSVTADSTGTIGLASYVIFGAGESEQRLNGFGALFIDLALPFTLLQWFPLPSSVTVDVDPSFPVPQTLYAQEFAFGVGAGNFSNVVRLDFE